jgi:hypothetical protein
MKSFSEGLDNNNCFLQRNLAFSKNENTLKLQPTRLLNSLYLKNLQPSLYQVKNHLNLIDRHIYI